MGSEMCIRDRSERADAARDALARLAADAEVVVRAAADTTDGAHAQRLVALGARHAAHVEELRGALAEAEAEATALRAQLRAGAFAPARNGDEPGAPARAEHELAARWASSAHGNVHSALSAAASEKRAAASALAAAQGVFAREMASARAELDEERAAASAARADAAEVQLRLGRTEETAKARATERARAHARALDALGLSLIHIWRCRRRG